MLFSKKLVHIKHIQFITKDLEKIDDVRKLGEKKRYLYQTYIIQLVASWQGFIETLLTKTLNKVLSDISNDNVKEALKTNLKKQIKRFNTPNSQNVNELFSSLLGVEKILDRVTFNELSSKEVKKKLEDILQIRHDIAHTGNTKNVIGFCENFDYMKHLFNVAYYLEYIVKTEVLCENIEFEIPYNEENN